MTKTTPEQLIRELLEKEHIMSIAKKTGISRQRLYQILKGNTSLRLNTFVKIINACGYDIEFKLKKRNDY